MSALAARWATLWRDAGGSGDGATLGDALIAAWSRPDRAYHTVDHLAACLDHLDRDRALARDPAALGLGLWFHDAVYDPRAGDNELRSAQLARSALAVLCPALAERVAVLVLATRHDGAPTDDDARLLVDIDLAILGADDVEYAAYEQAVRREYAWVAEADFRVGRARILRGFLARPSIYATAVYRQRFAVRARANLMRAVAAVE